MQSSEIHSIYQSTSLSNQQSDATHRSESPLRKTYVMPPCLLPRTSCPHVSYHVLYFNLPPTSVFNEAIWHTIFRISSTRLF